MKRCSTCREWKPGADFYANRASKDGKQAFCKPCHLADYRKRYAKNPAKRRKAMRQYNLKRNYGIGIGEYEKLSEKQNGGCAICGERTKRALVVDHDHATGQVRGLLCDRCNPMIGYAKEDPGVLFSALIYLRKHRMVKAAGQEANPTGDRAAQKT